MIAPASVRYGSGAGAVSASVSGGRAELSSPALQPRRMDLGPHARHEPPLVPPLAPTGTDHTRGAEALAPEEGGAEGLRDAPLANASGAIPRAARGSSERSGGCWGAFWRR